MTASRVTSSSHHIICLYHQVASSDLAGCSGLAVTCPTAVWEEQGSNPTVGSCMFLVKTTTIYTLRHGLQTLTAVLGQLSLLPSAGWYQLSGWVIIINGDDGCGFWQPIGGLTAWVVWPGLRVVSCLAPFHIHHMNRVNSRSGFELRWQHQKYSRWYYYYYYIRLNEIWKDKDETIQSEINLYELFVMLSVTKQSVGPSEN